MAVERSSPGWVGEHRAREIWVAKWMAIAAACVPVQVINDAFDLLVGSDSTPGRPLSAVVLLLRGLWEYLHHHGLGRLLAKPFKLLLALRNVLLVGLESYACSMNTQLLCVLL